MFYRKFCKIYSFSKIIKNISEWMKTMKYTNYSQLEAFYSAKLLGIAFDLNKKVTVWQGKRILILILFF